MYTVITLFSWWKYFRTALVIRKFVPRILFRYKEFFSVAILLFGRWLMVVPCIDHGNSVPDTRVDGLFRAS